MGKNTVTEDDLIFGLGGGFGNIGQMGSGRPVRDNPFRNTLAEPTPQAPAPQAASQQSAEPRAAQPEPVAREVPPKRPVRAAQAAPQPVAAPVNAAPVEPAAPTTPVQARAAKLRPLKKLRKTDTYSEKMSTFLSPEMRDELELTARLLHRNRLVKGESITVHTLIRSGVRVITELLEFTDSDTVSSEEELDALIRKKLGA